MRLDKNRKSIRVSKLDVDNVSTALEIGEVRIVSDRSRNGRFHDLIVFYNNVKLSRISVKYGHMIRVGDTQNFPHSVRDIQGRKDVTAILLSEDEKEYHVEFQIGSMPHPPLNGACHYDTFTVTIRNGFVRYDYDSDRYGLLFSHKHSNIFKSEEAA